MRAPVVLPLGSEPLVLVQAGRTLAIAKPEMGRSGLLQLAPGETLDLSAIANETIALVKLGNRVVVLFQDRSYVVVDGLYLPNGDFTPGVRVALDSSTSIDPGRFASQFGLSSDESILTAAGVSVAPRGSGDADDAAAPPSAALNPESSLTPGSETTSGFDPLPPTRAPLSIVTSPAAQVATNTTNGAGTGVFGFDLDTQAAGSGYAGMTQAEAALSRDPTTVGATITSDGVSLGQTDEASVADPRPHDIAVNLSSPSDRVVSIDVALAAAASGDKGLLRLSAGFLTLASDSIAIDDGAGTLTISYAAGYDAGEAAALLATLRYVNTDRTFLLDASDRVITVTITDQNGNSSTATATIPIAADVADFAGEAGINAFTGGRFSDRIIGLDGDDILNGGSGGDDIIDGGADDDTIIAADGNNQLIGGNGDNQITAGDGNNLITGGSGDDVVAVGNGSNTMTLGDGDNTVSAGHGGNAISTGIGDDTITTGDGNDTILAGDGGNMVASGGGDDRIATGRGDDVIDAGAGSDRIAAGRGDDDITGGAGSDAIVYDGDLAQIGFDTLRDFASGTDTLEFAQAVVGGGLAAGGGDTGMLDVSRFTTGSSFTDADQRFRYDSASKILFYDADGSGAGQGEIALSLIESGVVVASDIRIA